MHIQYTTCIYEHRRKYMTFTYIHACDRLTHTYIHTHTYTYTYIQSCEKAIDIPESCIF